MNIETRKKQLDKTQLNIGVELECFLVHTDSLKEISQKRSQIVFQTLKRNFHWQLRSAPPLGEIHSAVKEIAGYTVVIQLDVSYAIFEIITPPVPNLDILENLIKQSLAELKAVLWQYRLMIWPFGVAPASTFLLKLPFRHRAEIINDLIYRPLMRLESMPRLCYITSHQVNIDVPLQKLIPALNALYKNLGAIINKFANSPVYASGKLYREGRYYFWNEENASLHTDQYNFGGKPIFPQTPFQSLDDFFTRVWQGQFVFLIRNGNSFIFKDKTMSTHRLLAEKAGVALDIHDNERAIELTKEDIPLLFHLNWLDFKPHFDFDESFTLSDFLSFYKTHNIDAFFEKHCTHSWIEIRPCSPHFENNAMDIPRYFYEIFQNLDAYIEKSHHIAWEDARLARDRAIGYV